MGKLAPVLGAEALVLIPFQASSYAIPFKQRLSPIALYFLQVLADNNVLAVGRFVWR